MNRRLLIPIGIGVVVVIIWFVALWAAQGSALSAARKRKDTARAILQGEAAAARDFDVFLCHNHQDKDAVEAIARRLKERGLSPWLDKWELAPAVGYIGALEEIIKKGERHAQ